MLLGCNFQQRLFACVLTFASLWLFMVERIVAAAKTNIRCRWVSRQTALISNVYLNAVETFTRPLHDQWKVLICIWVYGKPVSVRLSCNSTFSHPARLVWVCSHYMHMAQTIMQDMSCLTILLESRTLSRCERFIYRNSTSRSPISAKS